MTDTIALCEPVECCNVGHSIVGYNLLNSSPSAQDFFEKECTKCVSSLSTKSTPLWPCCERTSSLNDVPKSACMWHEHCVDVGLVEDGCWCGNSGWNPDFCCLVNLALCSGMTPRYIALRLEKK